MAEKSNIMKHETRKQMSVSQRLKREKALEALRHLREIGEKLPPIDAAAVIREGRDLGELDSR